MKMLLLCLFLASMVSLPAQISISGSPSVTEQSYAKFAPLDKIDKAGMEILYEYSAIDPVLDEIRSYIDILQVGNTYTKYFGYPQYQIDSVIYQMDISRISTQEASRIFSLYRYPSKSPYTIVKNRKKSTLDYYDRIFIDYYVYHDSIAIQWILEDDTATVCGYPCQTATCSFRGRTWKAYYTTEIARNDGPWKFSGLPGMILKLEDNKGEQTFTAISVRNADSDIYIEMKRDRMKTTRTRYNERYRDYCENQSNVLTGNVLLGKDANTGKSIPIVDTRRFYSPVELE